MLSSGDGGGFPRGVPIGVAAKGIDGSWRVKLFSDRGAIDYVRVMLFEDFGQLVNPEALNAAPLAGLGTAPAPNAAETAAIGDATARRTAAAPPPPNGPAGCGPPAPAGLPGRSKARGDPRPAAPPPANAASGPAGRDAVRRPVAVRVVGPVQWIVYPALAVLAATLVLAVPVELFGLKLPEPVMPMMLAFAWPLMRPSMIAPVVLILVGLFIDLFWGGMLGVWAAEPSGRLRGGVAVAQPADRAGDPGAVRLVRRCCTLAFFLTYLIVSLDAMNAPASWR
jgi:rod shape-determining protein MreD